jgi:hypothetical protein
MTNDILCVFLQNRLIQTSEAGGQQYSDTSPFSIPWLNTRRRFQPVSVTLSTLASIETKLNQFQSFRSRLVGLRTLLRPRE